MNNRRLKKNHWIRLENLNKIYFSWKKRNKNMILILKCLTHLFWKEFFRLFVLVLTIVLQLILIWNRVTLAFNCHLQSFFLNNKNKQISSCLIDEPWHFWNIQVEYQIKCHSKFQSMILMIIMIKIHRSAYDIPYLWHI